MLFQNNSKQNPLLLEDRRFYVYALLDPRFNGVRMYRDLKYVFNHPVFYIGKGHNDRYEDHINDADDLWEKPEKINIWYNPIKIRKIHQIYRDYDVPRVVIIKEGLTEQEAFKLETFCIKQIGRINLGTSSLTNLTDGGEGWSGYIWTDEQKENFSGENHPRFGKKHTEETKQLISKSRKGKTYEEIMGKEKAQDIKKEMSNNRKNENNSFFGKHHTEETKQYLRESGKNQEHLPHTEEIKQHLREINLGEKNPMFGVTGKNHPRFGKKHTEETKQKCGLVNKGRKDSLEVREKKSKSHKGLKHTEETKQKCRLINKGKKRSKESNIKQSNSMKKKFLIKKLLKILKSL